MSDRMTFQGYVLARAARCGMMTLREVAEAAGMSPSMLTRVLRRQRAMTSPTALRMAKTLGVSVQTLRLNYRERA